MFTFVRSILPVAVLAAAPSFAAAITVPFTEDFTTDAADWRDNASAPLTWVSAGGPDGSAYVSTTFNFVSASPTDVPALFRAQDEFNSSGNAFAGDWIAAGVTSLDFYVRHNASVPVTFFVRLSGPANFPGVAAIAFTPVMPNVWTPISIAIDPSNPAFIFEGPSNFTSVFSNVGHIQIGVDVPDPLAGVDQSFTFDLDQVSVIPAPGAAALLAVCGLAGFGKRRRRNDATH